ncbi:MAG: LacI family DNA-binding transcriptional regulator [Candidatus Dormibacteraeota bacterium]|nr:LacI family DNA-binding transcriptional regulator [Candidatus Dormibacteraeota bacterium]
MATMKDVAAAAGVSTATVSYVLNGRRFVNPETRERVRAAIEALQYDVNDTARSLRRRTTSTLALIVPDLGNPFWPELAAVLQQEAPRAGYDIVLYSIDLPHQLGPELFHHYLRAIRGKRYDAVIYAEALRLGPLSVQELVDTGTPVVLIGGNEYPGTDRVYIDDYAAARDLMRHLLGRGHSRIAHITGAPAMASTRQRLRAYRESLTEAGVEIDPELEVEGTFLHAGGYAAMQRLLERRRRPTAVFAANDLTALGAMAACVDSGVNVPGEVAIAGFDDIAMATYVRPALTTVSHGQQDLGREAVRLAIQAHERRLAGIDAVEVGEPETVIVPHHLVVRDSA